MSKAGVDSSQGEPLLRKKGSYRRCTSHANDELHSFRSCLRWMCVDQSDGFHAAISWSLFLFLAIAVPTTSHTLLSCSATGAPRRAYDAVVQLSLTSASVLSYLSLTAFVRRFGLRRFLFLDKLVGESERVRLGYTIELSRSFRLLSFFVLPCFAAECGWRVWWYVAAGRRGAAAEVVLCIAELASWVYRTAIFFLVVVLFRLSCHLQILRLQDFAAAFEEQAEVVAVLRWHLRIRRQLKVTSHRYRAFIMATLALVTASQFVTLLLTTRPHANVSLFTAGELALCSIGLVTGLSMCLRSAAKITHKAQEITSHAATWHAWATIDSFGDDPEAGVPSPVSTTSHPVPPVEVGVELDDDEEITDEDELDDRKLVSHHVHTISFQKRHALVTYLENNRAGITMFGFQVDRTWLHTIFMIELSLVLWLLGKTIGIS